MKDVMPFAHNIAKKYDYDQLLLALEILGELDIDQQGDAWYIVWKAVELHRKGEVTKPCAKPQKPTV